MIMNVRDFAKKLNELVGKDHGDRKVVFYDEDSGIVYEYDRMKKDSLDDESMNIYLRKVD